MGATLGPELNPKLALDPAQDPTMDHDPALDPDPLEWQRVGTAAAAAAAAMAGSEGEKRYHPPAQR